MDSNNSEVAKGLCKKCNSTSGDGSSLSYKELSFSIKPCFPDMSEEDLEEELDEDAYLEVID